MENIDKNIKKALREFGNLNYKRVKGKIKISDIAAINALKSLELSNNLSVKRNSNNLHKILFMNNYKILPNIEKNKSHIYRCICNRCGLESNIRWKTLIKFMPCIGCLKSMDYDRSQARGLYTDSLFKKNKKRITEPTFLYWAYFTSYRGNSYFKIGIDSTGRRWSKNIDDYHVVQLLRLKTTKLIAFRTEQYILKKYNIHRVTPTDININISGKTEFFNDNMLMTDVESVIKQCIYTMNIRVINKYSKTQLNELNLSDISIPEN